MQLREPEKQEDTDARNDHLGDGDNILWWLPQENIYVSYICISLFSLLVRVCVSFHSYSGAGNPPMFGDYEAQRHWMEITLNLPAKGWYHNSTKNDLSYWGLDYPPLTAYQSFVHGLLLNKIYPEAVALYSSRGHESYLGKVLMRWTVLSSDIVVFFTSVLYFVIVKYRHFYGCKRTVAYHIATLLLNPCLILIDHGHFQYNCISLGFTLGAVAAILSGKDLVACSLFCLALNHKQMSAYFVPAFFSYLLGKCLRCQKPLVELLKMGCVVLASFAITWWPYLYSMDAVSEVLLRLVPFERGIFEDYVANFWCVSSIIFKWKKLCTTHSLKLLSLIATISACMPSMIQQIRAPSSKGFLYAMLNSSLAFYLFSFQVHEKSILLPLLPASLLALEEPFLYRWLTHYALVSMFPLVCRDRLIVPYIALFILFYLLYLVPGRGKDLWGTPSRTSLSLHYTFLLIFSMGLNVFYVVVRPPEKYPYLVDALLMALCFSQFMMIACHSNIKQWILPRSKSSLIGQEKKVL